MGFLQLNYTQVIHLFQTQGLKRKPPNSGISSACNTAQPWTSEASLESWQNMSDPKLLEFWTNRCKSTHILNSNFKTFKNSCVADTTKSSPFCLGDLPTLANSSHLFPVFKHCTVESWSLKKADTRLWALASYQDLCLNICHVHSAQGLLHGCGDLLRLH